MARTTPRVQQGRLDIHNGSQTIAIDSPAWFSWLTEHRVFGFTSPVGNFTARKEQRAAGWYWYAYHRHHGSLRNVYLGKTEELTHARLIEIAGKLNSVQGSSVGRMATQQFLLTTKMIPPTLAPTTIARPRLITAMRELTTRKLCLIIGPAGSGKTTLLSSWLHEFPRSAAWISLDEGDNNLTRFWSYVLAALQRSVPDFAAHLLTLLPTLQVETLEPFLILLVNALATLPHELVLVLDDYHLVTNQAVQESVAFLIEHVPEQLHMVLSSRTLPPLALPRLRARGNLAELNFTDLRFTSQEAEELLSRLVGSIPDVEMLSRLLEYTQGWATGLTLAAFSLHEGLQSGMLSTFISQGDYHASFEYLASEVLALQPQHVRDFLLYSSILERFNGALCDAVTLQDHSQDLPRQLDREGLFLSPLDDQHLWYRYHQLFADFLRSYLDQAYPGQAEELQRRAAGWYAQHNMPVEAITYALRAHDFPLAAHLIEAQGRNVLMRHEVVVLSTWLRSLPEEIVLCRPRLCIFAAWTLLHTSNTLAIEHYLCAAKQGLAHNEIPQDERQALCGEIAAIRARVAIYQGNIEQSISLSQQALSWLADNDHYLRGEVALSLGTSSEAIGETQKAERAYSDAIERSQRCDNLRTAMLARRSLALLHTHQGKLRQAYKLYQDGLDYALQTHQDHLPPVGFLYVGLGELCYEWNDLQTAEEHLRKGIALGKRGGDVKIWLLGYSGLLYILIARHEYEQAWSLLAEAEHLARQTCFTRGSTWLQLIRLHLAAKQGNTQPLLEWAQQYHLDLDEQAVMRQMDEYALQARAMIIHNKPELALHILHRLREVAEHTCLIGYKITFLLNMARAYELQGKTDLALEMLADALAGPQGYMRIFIDEGAPILALLRKLRRSHRYSYSPRYLNQLLLAFNQEQSTPHEDHASERLSQREREVLHLLAAGHSNAEIASTLVIGLNTVKTHLKNIYGKLGANNRTQAIAQARRQQLL